MNAIEYAQRANELFAVPNTSNQLRLLFDRDDSTMKDIAGVVSGDPGLALHLLKYANSSVYRFERKIESLEKAIQVIGAKAVYEFSLAFGITNMLGTKHKKYIDVTSFWKQSILSGLYGAYFAKRCKERDVGRLYTSGLLHNVGELAVLRVSPTLAQDCSRLKVGILPRQCQEEILGFSYAEVSASLLQQWLVPDSLVSTVAMQHHDEAPAVTVESQIMQLAYALAVVNTYPEHYSAELHIPEFLYTSLQLDEEALGDAEENCREQFESLATIFKVASGEHA
ncbi:MAG: HD-like signal output (HDOD) protein [Alphaproteobacteria bacterium]|jgi:HD-like signal output (HDOD) protein